MSRRSYALVGTVLAACSFRPSGAPVDGGGTDSSVGSAASITDDTASDFLAGSPDNALDIADRGALEPRARIERGLRARGCSNTLQTTSALPTWAALEASCMVTGTGYAQVPQDWAGSRPRGLGLTNNDAFSVLYDGEIRLPAGTTSIKIDPDDRAFFEIALDGKTFTQQTVIELNPTAEIQVTPPNPTGDFYPIHLAITETGGSAHLLVTANNGGSAVTLAYRRDVTRDSGVAVVEYGPGFVGPSPLIVAAEKIGGMFGATAPAYDLADSAPADYALRFIGQVYIADTDSYTFGVLKDANLFDFARIWIDGTLVAEDFGLAPYTTTSAPLALATGWHDLFAEISVGHDDHSVSLGVTMARGSDAAHEITSDQLRPAMTGGEAVSVLTGPVTLGATSSIPLNLPPLAGYVIDAYDLAVTFKKPTRAVDYTTALLDGSDALLTVPITAENDALAYAQDQTAGLAGTPAGRMLAIGLTYIGAGPQSGGQQISFTSFVTTGHGGLPAPFPAMTTYTSAVHATKGAMTITGVTVVGVAAPGGAFAMRIRVGPDASSLGAPVDVPIGTPVSIPAGEVLQYELQITTGGGWHAGSVERVQIDYVTRP